MWGGKPAPQSYSDAGDAPFVFGQDNPNSAPLPGGGAGGRGDTVVQQTVNVGEINVQPDTGASPGQYGAATKEGVKRALSDTAKDNANTLNAVTPP
jgi:hypothetical protein